MLYRVILVKKVPLIFEFFPKSNYITLIKQIKNEIWKYLELLDLSSYVLSSL